MSRARASRTAAHVFANPMGLISSHRQEESKPSGPSPHSPKGVYAPQYSRTMQQGLVSYAVFRGGSTRARISATQAKTKMTRYAGRYVPASTWEAPAMAGPTTEATIRFALVSA